MAKDQNAHPEDTANALEATAGSRPVEHLMRTQDAILAETEAYVRDWFDRRHAAVRTGMELVEELRGDAGRTPGAALQAVGAWQAESLGRLSEDARQFGELWTRCAWLLAGAQLGSGAFAAASTTRSLPVPAHPHSTPV